MKEEDEGGKGGFTLQSGIFYAHLSSRGSKRIVVSARLLISFFLFQFRSEGWMRLEGWGRVVDDTLTSGGTGSVVGKTLACHY